MKRLFLVAIWAGFLVADGMIWPSLSGWSAGFGSIIFLVALALTFGIHRWVIGWGFAFAFATELFFGFYFGSLMGTWLILCWVWHIAGRFLSIKPLSDNDSWLALIPLAVSGAVLFTIAECGEWSIVRWAYDRTLTPTILKLSLNSPVILATVAVELFLLLVVFRFIYAPRVSVYG
jgi:hypothetical protein